MKQLMTSQRFGNPPSKFYQRTSSVLLFVISTILDCEFIIDDVNATLAAAQLNINALIHQQGANVTGAKRNL